MADLGPQSSKFIGLSSNRGFLAIQGIIGAAIVGIMLAVLLSVVGNLSELTGNYIAKEELDSVMQKVQNVLLTENTCSGALHTSLTVNMLWDGQPKQLDQISVRNSISTGQIPLIRRGELTPTIVGGAVSYSGKVRIDDIQLEKVSSSSTRTERIQIPPTLTNPVWTFRDLTAYIAKITVSASYQNKRLPDQTIALKVFTFNGQIERCFSMGTDIDSCTAFEGDVDPVTRRCVLPECSAATIATLRDEVPQRGFPCGPPRPGGVCTPRNPAYFWVFRDDRPVCICLQRCT